MLISILLEPFTPGTSCMCPVMAPDAHAYSVVFRATPTLTCKGDVVYAHILALTTHTLTAIAFYNAFPHLWTKLRMCPSLGLVASVRGFWACVKGECGHAALLSNHLITSLISDFLISLKSPIALLSSALSNWHTSGLGNSL